jgi:hypothetical protein
MSDGFEGTCSVCSFVLGESEGDTGEDCVKIRVRDFRERMFVKFEIVHHGQSVRGVEGDTICYLNGETFYCDVDNEYLILTPAHEIRGCRVGEISKGEAEVTFSREIYGRDGVLHVRPKDLVVGMTGSLRYDPEGELFFQWRFIPDDKYPKKPGFYWAKVTGNWEPVKVVERDGSLQVATYERLDTWPVGEYEWGGPVKLL